MPGCRRVRTASSRHLLPFLATRAPLSYGTALTLGAPTPRPRFRPAAGRGPGEEEGNSRRAPDNGRATGASSQSGYPQGVWMNDRILWRTRRFLCTGRGTGLWRTCPADFYTGSELLFSHPPAVQEKNFATRVKIATNGAEDLTPGEEW
ncbi:hypothetical protein GCM10023079_19350 [Streptomyces chitinivorans]